MKKTKTRKIINIGGSYGVTIPRQFIEANNLKFGDDVAIAFDTILLVVNPELPEGLKAIHGKSDKLHVQFEEKKK